MLSSFSHTAISFACINGIKTGQLIKLDSKMQGTQFISLCQHKVYKLIQSDYKPIKLTNTVSFDDSDMSSSDDNDEPNKEIKANNNVTNKTNNTYQKTRNNRQYRRINQKQHHSRRKLINIKDGKSDDDTIDTPATAKPLLIHQPPRIPPPSLSRNTLISRSN
jgi:hypothetical protein